MTSRVKDIFLVIVCLTTFVIGLACGAERQRHASKLPAQPSSSVCDISSRRAEFLGSTVSFRAHVTGYHYLFAFDDSCQRPGSSIYLNLSPEVRKRLIDELSELIKKEIVDDGGNFNFSALISGSVSNVDSKDELSPCYVPSDVISPEIRTCLRVSSLTELKGTVVEGR